MSVVVGIAENGRVTLGADSLLATGWTIYESDPPKVFKHPSGLLFGVVGDARAWTVLRYSFDPPPPGDKDDLEYMSSVIALRLRDDLRGNFIGRDDKKDDSERATEVLIGYNGVLYRFHASGFVHALPDGYAAIGGAGDLALGAVVVAQGSPKARIKKALEVAEKHRMTVRRPFVYVSGTGRLNARAMGKSKLGADYLTGRNDEQFV